jgi:hypothetical protein
MLCSTGDRVANLSADCGPQFAEPDRSSRTGDASCRSRTACRASR